MSEALKELLDAILPTYQYQMPAGKAAAITYQPVYASDSAYESGEAIEEHWSFRVTVFQKKQDPQMIQRIVKALRAAGWTITDRAWMIDTENKYYQHAIDIDKWEEIRNENNRT